VTLAAGDFAGRCLIGDCQLTSDVLLPGSTLFGLPKSASYFYGTWRDSNGRLSRALRGVGGSESSFRYVFREGDGPCLEIDPATDELFTGKVTVAEDGTDLTFASDASDPDFSFRHGIDSFTWRDSKHLDVEGFLVAPALQWFNPWPGGGCYSVTAKYRCQGTVLGQPVEGFVGHEVHFLPEGLTWMDTPYGKGREICWQQIANQYEDGQIEQATFAYGADGWGFAMVHEADGTFIASTEVEVSAEVRTSGYPEVIRYRFADQSWVWRIDPKGERALTVPGAPLGADGTCVREGETRRVLLSMGNSDWWTDGRAQVIIEKGRA
jgi:hypothetical protein